MAAVLTEKQSARRQRVLEAAMGLAREGGYDAVQMRDVAVRADVALGTLYRYFPSKNQLLVAALGEWARGLQQRIASRPVRGGSPADRVVEVLGRAVRALEREPHLTQAFVTALTSLSSDEPAGLQYARGVYETLAEIITTAMDHGEIPHPEEAIRVLGMVWLAALMARTRGWDPPSQMPADLEAAARLLIPG